MKLIWMYDAPTNGWWLVKDLPDGLHAQKVYGPFTEAEAKLAGALHGVPFVELK